MTKYSKTEIQTAKKLYDAGYKWMARDKFGGLYACSEKPRKTETFWVGGYRARLINVAGKLTPIFQGIKWADSEPIYIEDIINQQILDDAEKRYLSAVIRPFRNEVRYIRKNSVVGVMNKEYISIHFIKNDIACLPNFKRGTMYKGMEIDRKYTLEELEI